MNKLFAIGNQYVKESDWKVITVLKFCLLALGVLMGLAVPKKQKKAVAAVCVPVFVVTYVPLMLKLANVVLRNKD